MPEKAELVEKELLAEAELLRREGLTEEELKRAKAKVIGQRKIARQDLGGLAMTTALMSFPEVCMWHFSRWLAHWPHIYISWRWTRCGGRPG